MRWVGTTATRPYGLAERVARQGIGPGPIEAPDARMKFPSAPIIPRS